MQKLFLIGRLGRDAVLRESSNGDRFVAFTIAVNSKVRGAEKTTWYDVISFNVTRLENIIPYLKKGSALLVVGELDAKLEKGSDGVVRQRLTVTADSIDFTGVGNGQASGNTATNTVTTQTPKAVEPEDDDVPVITTKKSSKKTVKPVEESTILPEVEAEPVTVSADDDLPF